MKYNQNDTYMKDQAIDAVHGLNFCVNSHTLHASKNKRHKPYFFTHVVKFFQNPDGRENTLAAGHQDDNKKTYDANIHLKSNLQSISKAHIFLHKTFATTITEPSQTVAGRMQEN